jgi:Tfp pilus assembly protein PilZ
MKLDRRKRVRYDVNYPAVMLTSHGVFKGRTKNLSQHGALIRCQHLLEVNEKLRLVIELPLDPPLEVPAHVVWCKTTDSGGDGMPQQMGIRFTW